MSLTALKANGKRAPSMQKARAPVPLELEAMPLPLNTFKNKAPFTAGLYELNPVCGVCGGGCGVGVGSIHHTTHYP